jgi:hypothetical protein
MKAARASKAGAYIEIIGGKMDLPIWQHHRLMIVFTIVSIIHG